MNVNLTHIFHSITNIMENILVIELRKKNDVLFCFCFLLLLFVVVVVVVFNEYVTMTFSERSGINALKTRFSVLFLVVNVIYHDSVFYFYFFYFFNDDFYTLLNDAMRSCLSYNSLPFSSFFSPANRIPNTVNSRLEDTLL